MKLLRWLFAVVFVAFSVRSVPGTTTVPTFDEGIVCLDEATGTPLWEYFPDELSHLRLAIRDGRLLVLQRYWDWSMVGRGTQSPAPQLTVLDPATGQFLPQPPGPPEPIDELGWEWPPLITASGNRVVADGHNVRAITILKGDGPEVHRIIPTAGSYFQSITVQGDQVVFAPEYLPTSNESGPAVVAVDANTGETTWTIDGIDRVLGISSGTDRVYIFEPEWLRAIDPGSGKLIWRQRLPRVRHWSSANENGRHVFVVCDSGDGDSSQAFLYCLDLSSGRIRWTFDPQTGGSIVPLAIHEGRVYTLIAPSQLSRAVMRSPGCRTLAPADHDGRARRTPACLADRFGDKTDEEIELNLRAWHALGDRSLIPALQAAVDVVADSPLRGLPKSLIQNFPIVRNPFRLTRFLETRFEQMPDLGPEIRRVLDDFSPVPFHGEYEHLLTID